MWPDMVRYAVLCHLVILFYYCAAFSMPRVLYFSAFHFTNINFMGCCMNIGCCLSHKQGLILLYLTVYSSQGGDPQVYLSVWSEDSWRGWGKAGKSIKFFF